MKKLLLTWYGMTDLRASFGVEDTIGPILSLLNENYYDDVFILCHTQKNKETPQSFQDDLNKVKETSKTGNNSVVRDFVQKYSNTQLAHNVYAQWLLDKIPNKNINITFNPVVLDRLNDSDGIYTIVDKVMGIVKSITGEKEIHLFLSPGTPVMAFIWALSAIKYQDMDIKLISSSVVGQKAEFIDIPKAWREWKSTNDFDIIFNLFGDQRMPSYLSINQFKCNKHVFLSSKSHDANVMRKFLEGKSFDEIKIDAYDPLDVKLKILSYVKKFSPETKIGINLTGGTKLMYAGAMEACRKISATPFYFNIDDDNVIFLDSFEKNTLKNITSAKKFFELNTDELEIQEKRPKGIMDRIELSKTLYQNHKKVQRRYKEMIGYFNSRTSFEKNISDIKIKYIPNQVRQIAIEDKTYEFINDQEFQFYICGGWFEEYLYNELKILEDKGLIFDLCINIKLCIDNTGNSRAWGFGEKVDYQEIDICFSDGKRLYIIECKSGIVVSDHVEKLKNITFQYGGLGAVGILASCFKLPNKVVEKKLKDNKQIYSVVENYVREIANIIKNKNH